MSETLTIGSDALTAVIEPRGAELRALTDASGGRWLSDGDPAWWSGVAPLLFPVVGAVADDRIRIGDGSFPMRKHGIARKALFSVVDRSEAHVTLRLSDADVGRQSYPFAFLLEVTHRVEGLQLATTATVHNAGDVPMPFSLGFHPAFAWPLPGGEGQVHRVRFAEAEPQPIRRINPASGLILPDARPTPVEGDVLMPTAALFEPDAIIWDHLHSRSLRFGVEGGPELQLDFPDCPMLGIWQKPGAPFLCLEPWAGHADPLGYDGAFADKPGSMHLAPGVSRSFRLTVTLRPSKQSSSS